jgi:hypothetical protein
MENTLYFDNAAPDLSNLTDLVEAINTAIRGSLLPLLTNTIALVRVIGTLLDAIDGLQYISTTSLPASGGSSTSPMPNNDTLAIRFTSASRGRSARGRNFVVGMINNRDFTDQWNTTYVNSLVDAWVDIAAAGSDFGWTQVIASRITGGAPRTTGVSYAVTGISTADNLIDSQRRRLLGRGT